jgi:hypothetical protein
MSHQALVLDANILVRAVLGQRVFKLVPERKLGFFRESEADQLRMR